MRILFQPGVVTVEVAAHVDGGTVAIGAAGDGGGALQLQSAADLPA